MPVLFDMDLRARRRDRAARIGPELFLLERAFDDCLERIALMDRRFERALLIGCPDARWGERLGALTGEVECRDPGPLFAAAAGGFPVTEDRWEPSPQSFDLVLAIGSLDTVNDLPLAFRLVRFAMRPDGLFMAALSGGDTLPALRAAMLAADALSGAASPRVHPRIEPAALSPLLTDAGFVRPVVDVDRVQVSYRSLGRLAADLRAMAATNILSARGPTLTRAQRDAAERAFADAGVEGRTTETFELLHFAAFVPSGD